MNMGLERLDGCFGEAWAGDGATAAISPGGRATRLSDAAAAAAFAVAHTQHHGDGLSARQRVRPGHDRAQQSTIAATRTVDHLGCGQLASLRG